MNALMPPAPLFGTRVRLRPFTPTDAPALLRLHSHPDAMRYWSHTPWTELAQAEALLARDAAGLATGVRLAIDVAGAVQGSVSLFAWDRRNRRAEIGYLLHPDVWGQGLAREAVALVVEHGFGTVGLHRIEADTDPRNRSSVRLLEALGFQREGLLRERWLVGDEAADSALFGLLASEWRRP